jgi:chorismate lyase
MNPEMPTEGLRNALCEFQGTVTEFLEDLAGEAIVAKVLSQRTTAATDGNELGLTVNDDVLCRSALLVGQNTESIFVYAESVIAVERLPSSVLIRLQSTTHPIGRVLTDEGITVQRIALPTPPRLPFGSPELELLLGAGVWPRRCLLMAEATPVMDISEWFLQSVQDSFARQR